jgi:hypothetical protein
MRGTASDSYGTKRPPFGFFGVEIIALQPINMPLLLWGDGRAIADGFPIS